MLSACCLINEARPAVTSSWHVDRHLSLAFQTWYHRRCASAGGRHGGDDPPTESTENNDSEGGPNMFSQDAIWTSPFLMDLFLAHVTAA
jgi:hypothetical protein